jgi:hypothetical protein
VRVRSPPGTKAIKGGEPAENAPHAGLAGEAAARALRLELYLFHQQFSENLPALSHVPTEHAELIPREEHDRWMLTSHSALNGDWPALAMQKGNESALYHLLLRLKQG